MSTSQIRAIQAFISLHNRNAIGHAIRASVDLGILSALEDGQKTALQLAGELKLKTEPLQKLLDVLEETELIERYQDDYALSTMARLIPSSLHDFGDRHWQYLTNYVRTGTSIAADKDLPATDRDFLISKASQEWTHTPASLEMANLMGIGSQRKELEVLDLGCGAAVFGATIGHRDATSKITLLDQSAGLKRAEEMAKGVELENQVSYLEGDYTQLEKIQELDERAFDLVILSGRVHHHTREECSNIFKQVRTILKPKGELALIDVMPDAIGSKADERGHLTSAIFDLEVNLRSSKGAIHDVDDLKEDLKTSGFSKAEVHRLDAPPYLWTLVLAAV